jgi:hypothetical protein
MKNSILGSKGLFYAFAVIALLAGCSKGSSQFSNAIAVPGSSSSQGGSLHMLTPESSTSTSDGVGIGIPLGACEAFVVSVSETHTAFSAALSQSGKAQFFSDSACSSSISSLSFSASATALAFYLKDATSETVTVTASSTSYGSTTFTAEVISIPPPASASGTTIPSASQIVDSQGNIWTVSGGVVLENGADAGYSSGVILLLYYNGVIYQENSAKGWWSWVNSAWVGVTGDPRGSSPSPSPSPSKSVSPSPSPSVTVAPLPSPSPSASTIAVSSGNSQTAVAGTVLSTPLTVLVTGSNGKPFSGAVINWTVASGGGSLSSASSTTSATGLASTTLTLGKTAGSNTVKATINGTTTSVTFTETGSVGAASTIAISSGNTQSGTAGSPLPGNLMVLVKDANGNATTGTTINWAIATGGGSFSTATSTTSNGLASDTLILGKTAGSNTAKATINGTTTSVTFTETGVAGAASTIAISSGNAQSGTAGSTLPALLAVIVKDANGNAVSGSTITWSTTSGGSFTGATTTNSSGVASVSYKLGTVAGTETVKALVSGTSISINFSETATAVSAPSPSPSPTPTATGGTTVFNCSPFNGSTSGPCSAQVAGDGSPNFLIRNGGSFDSGVVILAPAAPGHQTFNMNYYTPVNVQAFNTSFVFVPNGQNLALIFNNSNNIPGYTGNIFASGAGCEGGFFQADASPFANSSQNKVFAAQVADSQDWLTYAGNNPWFTDSSVQIFQSQIVPCLPNQNQASGWTYVATNRISTAPVFQQATTGVQFSVTGHTYSATYTYTGSNLTLQMYDVTLGGSCPGASCFTYTWQQVYIPSIVGDTTSYIGLGAGTNQTSLPALTIDSWNYTALTPAATPTFSLAAGTYSGTQSVTISDSTASSYICYNFTGAPATNGIGGCTVGTLYTGAVSVSKGETIYAVAGVAKGAADSAVASAAYTITGTASTPTFYFGGGTYNGDVSVTLTAAHGGVICYNTTGSPETNGSTGCTTGTQYTSPIKVSSNETLYAVAGGSGFTDSSVGSAAYIINPFWDGSSPSGQAPANAPTFSPLPGTYSGAQSVTISTIATGPTTPYICYTLASSPPTLPPQTDNLGGCAVGTLYTGPVTVSSTQTIYAMAGTATASLPSTLVQGKYTINTSP